MTTPPARKRSVGGEMILVVVEWRLKVKELGAEVEDVGGLKLEEGGRQGEWGRSAGGARRWAAGLSAGLDAEASGREGRRCEFAVGCQGPGARWWQRSRCTVNVASPCFCARGGSGRMPRRGVGRSPGAKDGESGLSLMCGGALNLLILGPLSSCRQERLRSFDQKSAVPAETQGGKRHGVY